ncbi:MAG: hypothetical protein ABI640_17870 [Gammaproteobacteria bacterium]
MIRRSVTTIVAICAFVALSAVAAGGDGYKTTGGLAIYLGVLPAAMVQP